MIRTLILCASVPLCLLLLSACTAPAPVVQRSAELHSAGPARVSPAVVRRSPAVIPPTNLRMAWELDVPHRWIMTWDANEEPDLAGYKLRYGTAETTSPIDIIDVGNVTEHELMLPCLPQHYVMVCAYNAAGIEGHLSDPYWITGRDLRLTWDHPTPGTAFSVWRSKDLQTWSHARDVTTTNALLRVIPHDSSKEFYRVSVAQ